MFDTSDKRRVYWLIDKYLSNEIDTQTFDDEYHACFNVWIDVDSLSDFEEKILCELSDVTARFSEFESDHRNYPGAFYTAEEVRQKATEVKRKLADYWPDELKNT